MVRRGLAFIVAFLLTALPAIGYVNSTASLVSPPNGTLISGNETVNVTFTGSANVTIEYNITATFLALNSSAGTDGYLFTWATSNGSFADGLYGLRVIVANATDASDNATLFASNLTVDNTGPNVTGLAVTPNNPLNDSSDVNVTVSVSDGIAVSAVQVSNGSATVLMDLVSGTSSSGVYEVIINLSDLSCGNESRCSLAILADDTAGNTNDTVGTDDLSSPLYADTHAPVLLGNATNATSVAPGGNATVGALWRDAALIDAQGFTVTFALLDVLTGNFTNSTSFSAWSNGQLSANWTNATFHMNGSKEGQLFTFRVTLNDSYGRSNSSANLTTYVVNTSPTIAAVSPANNSYITNATLLTLEILDQGVGVNLTALAVNVSADALNASLTYAANSSLFDCSANYSTATWTDNRTCSLNITWIGIGNFSLSIAAKDQLGHENTSYVAYQVTSAPAVANITIDGNSVASAASAQANVSSASREVSFNWSVGASTGVNVTSISFLNESDPRNRTFTAIPAGTVYNVTGGRSYVRINATVVGSSLTDSVQVNLTANVPVNLSALEDQYEGGLISAWRVLEEGVDVSSQDRYVNATFDIVANLTNATSELPFEIAINHSALSGLTLRWNGSSDAFAARMASSSAVSELENITWGDVTLAIEHAGQMGIFLDGQRALVAVRANFTMDNRSAHYQLRNATTTTYLLSNCTSSPTGPINATGSCYSAAGSSTVFFLPRFDEQDRLVISEADGRAPNITIHTNSSIAQSAFPLHFAVSTPNPNATLCWYNLSRFNSTTNTTVDLQVAAVALSSFSAENGSLAYRQNFTQMMDSAYNLSVSCADAQGDANVSRRNVNLTDVTAPVITSNAAGGVTRSQATITGSSDELVTFSVRYGTNASDLSSTLTDSDEATSADLDLEDLSAGTTYYFNLTGCDPKGLCGTSDTKSFTTVAPSSGGSGGGGGGGGGEVTSASGAAETVDSRLWQDVAEGDTIDYEPAGSVIERVILGFSASSQKVVLTIKQYAQLPDYVAEFDRLAYKFILFEHQGLTDKASSYRVEFRVAKSWISDEGIALDTLRLYRLESGTWQPYDVVQTLDERDHYRYTASVPGFSWFAIGAEGSGAPEAPAVEEIAPPEAQEPAQEQPSELPSPAASPVSALEREGGSGFGKALAIFAIVVAVVLAGVGGLKYYQVYQEREVEHRKRIAKERREYEVKDALLAQRPKEHDPMAPLHEYIERMRAHGYDDEHIRVRLKQAGWDQVIVEEEMLR